jgi:hypothetical protein
MGSSETQLQNLINSYSRSESGPEQIFEEDQEGNRIALVEHDEAIHLKKLKVQYLFTQVSNSGSY